MYANPLLIGHELLNYTESVLQFVYYKEILA